MNQLPKLASYSLLDKISSRIKKPTCWNQNKQQIKNLLPLIPHLDNASILLSEADITTGKLHHQLPSQKQLPQSIEASVGDQPPRKQVIKFVSSTAGQSRIVLLRNHSKTSKTRRKPTNRKT